MRISKGPGNLGSNYTYLPTGKKKRINTITNILDPESLYDPSRKKGRTLQNLVDYREFIKRK